MSIDEIRAEKATAGLELGEAEERARVLTLICDRLESLADQNEDAAMTISAIREALKKTNPAFQAEYDKLYSNFRALAANRRAGVELQEIRRLIAQLSRPKS
jgi:hypothetical protein